MEKISIITGGSSGLGKEIAKLLVAKGEKVLLVARNQERLNAAKKEMGDLAMVMAGDLCDEAFVKSIFVELNKKELYPNYLFNCAGVGIYNEPQNVDLDQIKKTMDSNTIGLMNISYEALRNMPEGGTLVNVASTAALKGNANESLYCASKWAVRGFTEALQAYYNKKNIHVIGVYPGGMNTPFWANEDFLKPDVNKFMDPKEVAEQIVFATSDKNTLYNSTLIIDRK